MTPASAGTLELAPASTSCASRKSSATFSACIMPVRRVASAVSSPACGASFSSSSTAWRSQSPSRLARSTSARCASAASCAVRRASHSASTLPASSSSPPKASSRRRWVAASTSARSSCWPWISTSAEPSCFITCTLTGWSLTKARVRPSANCTRRRISSSSAAMSLALRMARAGCERAISKEAVT